MKLLTLMLLVNWHYYTIEWVDFKQINFLTGKTGAGKSTLVDALQIVLLGDTNGQHFFNKAANDRSRRSLKGYLRGEYGDDGGSGFLYLRNSPFSSYLACEFHDTEKGSDFTLGIVFDCNYSATDESNFFILKDRIPDSGFLKNSCAMEIRDLKQFLRQNYDKNKFEICSTAREYQQKMASLLGGLTLRYFSLLRKAVSFTPIIDIEEFITNNICDSKKPPDLSGMQDNLRQYRRLEQEAQSMQERIGDLEKIASLNNALQDELQKLRLYAFLVSRAETESARRELAAIDIELADVHGSLLQNQQAASALAAELADRQAQRDSLIEQRGQSDIYQRQQQLQTEIAKVAAEAALIESSLSELAGRLNQYGLIWRKAAAEAGKLLSVLSAGQAGGAGPLNRNLTAFAPVLDQFETAAEALMDFRRDSAASWSPERFESCRQAGEAFQQQRQLLEAQLELLLEQAQRDVEDCEDRIADLKRDIKPYDASVNWFCQDLRTHLSEIAGRPVEVDILADLLEIGNPRWANVIEGYLSRQKQYLLVEPAYYPAALQRYDQLRHSKKLYDVSLIDGEKVTAAGPTAMSGSLAGEVVTGNPAARCFVDFLIGKVIKCDRIEDLRRHERAVTDQGVLYQGYVVSSINPSLWQYHLIGKRSIQQQIERLVAELPAKKQCQLSSAAHVDASRAIRRIEIMSNNESADSLERLAAAGKLPELREMQKQFETELRQLDLSWIFRLNNQIDQLKVSIAGQEQEIRQISEQIGSLRRTETELAENRKPACQSRLLQLEAALAREYPAEFRIGDGELRFKNELASKLTPEKIIVDFRSQVGMRQSSIANFQRELANARADYNRRYNYTFDVSSTDNRRYDSQLTALREEQLPQYKDKIENARKMAYEQFANQFLAEMKANIQDVRDRIEELNRALRDNRFGNERFSFQILENPDYKRFYDMINDPMLMEGYTLMSKQFLDKHGATIDELFSRIVDLGTAADSDQRAEIERNIKIFTDFKTYLRFDMISIDENDNRQRLSRTLLKKSGGETQTPFYIAMLASFAQLYHINDRKWNCSRLIIFDEAFSKMDGERIRESIQLLKQIGFQCILSAPPEKIGDIAPLVDRNIAVIKRGFSSFTRAFDAGQLQTAFGANEGTDDEV